MLVNSALFAWLDLHSTVRRTYDLGRGVFFIFKSTEVESDKNEALTTLFQTQMSQIPLCDFCWQVLIESAQTEQFEAKGQYIANIS